MATSEDLEGDSWPEPDAAVRASVDPASIVGRTLREVVVGWQCFGDERSPVLLFLRLDADWLEACTPADDSVRLDRSSQPSGFDMDKYGRFEMHAADESHPLHGLIGSRVLRVRHLRWRERDVGLVLMSDRGSVVIANAGDELFVSAGEPPPGYADAVIVH